MATWHGFVDYVRSNYRIAQETQNALALVFEFDDGRSQMVVLRRQQLRDGSEEWLQIESPCADVGNVSLQRLLEVLGGMVCGGAVIVDDRVHLRSAMPLSDMNVAEFERPLQLITGTADQLEQQLSGGDRY